MFDWPEHTHVQVEFPHAVFAGGGFLHLAGKGDQDLVAGIRPTPDGHRLVALQHHVVGDDRGQFELGEGAASEQKTEKQREERNRKTTAHKESPVVFEQGGKWTKF